MGPGVLTSLLRDLPRLNDDRLIIGYDSHDDAAVYLIRDDLAVITTIDFFPPIVDDPYDFGRIAAANALSDVYAMGGEPKIALNLLCASESLCATSARAILQGGADKAVEAGVVIAGGHSIADQEPKYGLAVTGFAHPSAIRANDTVQDGDVFVLTKRLGSGVLTTAMKSDLVDADTARIAIDEMARLNRNAALAMKDLPVSACTDITGFGLMGHLYEMLNNTPLTIDVYASALPLLPKALTLAEEGLIPAGAYRNRTYVDACLTIDNDVERARSDLAFDPQTSGGLLIALPERHARTLIARLVECGDTAALIAQAQRAQHPSLHLHA